MLIKIAGFTARILPASVRRRLYQLGPISYWLRKSLTRAAPSGRKETRVAAGYLQGCRLFLDLRTEKDYWLGTYEPELQDAIRHFVRPGMTAYDVGANIGYTSLMLARAILPGGRVYAFEALPQNAARMRDNLALNGLERAVQVVEAAVIDRPGEAEFLVHGSTSMGKAAGSGGRSEDYPQRMLVPGLSLDEFVYGKDHPLPQVVKMDIEGGETLALPGMARLLAEGRPLVFLELHGEDSALAAWSAFQKASYDVRGMKTGYPALDHVGALNWKMYLVAVPAGYPHHP